MIEYIGAERIGTTGRYKISIAKFERDNNKKYYHLAIVDTKTTQIVFESTLDKQHLKMFKKLVNDSNLEGMKI